MRSPTRNGATAQHRVLVIAGLSFMQQAMPPDVHDRACSTTPLPILETNEVTVLAACTNTPTGSLVELILANKSGTRGGFRDLTLLFCGSVVRASAPRDWLVDLRKERSPSREQTYVSWTTRVHGAKGRSIRPGTQMRGFQVEVRKPWSVGKNYAIGFEGSGGGTGGSPHDCLYGSDDP